MNPFKLIGWAGLAVAIVSAFVDFQYAAAILVVLGIAAAFGIAVEDSVRVLVTALVLASLSGVLMNIPAVGEPLTKIFGGFGTFAAGASLTRISRNVWNRYKP